MRVTLIVSVTIEEADGDANTFALTKVKNTGDNPNLITQECREVINPSVAEILSRVETAYSELR